MHAVIFHSVLCVLLVLSSWTESASAGDRNVGDRMERGPAELEGVDVVERLGGPLPLHTKFVDETGKTRRLSSIIGDKPVILTFNYSNCPMLCGVQLSGLVDALVKMDWTVGQDFEIITIGLDPLESTQRVTDTKARYLERYGRSGAADGWRFLRGDAASIRLVAEAVGFGYRYHPERKEYLHPAVLTYVSPAGAVSGYTYGVSYDESEIRDKLIVARVGDVSQSLMQFILSCYHLEARTGNSVVVAKIMKYGGLVFLIGFVFALTILRMKRSVAVGHTHYVGSTENHV